jgi:hypothetical protein
MSFIYLCTAWRCVFYFWCAVIKLSSLSVCSPYENSGEFSWYSNFDNLRIPVVLFQFLSTVGREPRTSHEDLHNFLLAFSCKLLNIEQSENVFWTDPPRHNETHILKPRKAFLQVLCMCVCVWVFSGFLSVRQDASSGWRWKESTFRNWRYLQSILSKR